MQENPIVGLNIDYIFSIVSLQGLRSKPKHSSALKHPLSTPFELFIMEEGCNVTQGWGGLGLRMLLAAGGRITLPTLQSLLLNSLGFVLFAVALPCRNYTVCVSASLPHEISFSLLWEIPGYSGKMQTSLGTALLASRALPGAWTLIKCFLGNVAGFRC